MPELPEVQTIVTTLRPHLRGERILAVRLLRDDIISPPGLPLRFHLEGKSIADVTRRGKKIIVALDGGERFYIHLGMTGRLTMEKTISPLEPHTHLVLELSGGRELRFRDPRRFGGVWWLGANNDGDDHLGPEPLEMKWPELAERLARTRRAVKTALLDQSLVAGLGNIYVDESLFAAGIHPLIAANRLDSAQVQKLNRAIKTVLTRALKHKGSTLRDYRNADGAPGEFQKVHRVYDRAGKPCLKCRAAIVRIVIGGRSTHFCATCQPAVKRKRT
ncbi:MAG TPA: bifunctional DNA-formamidopyrimidine glycosylase/DNA-(apurinic or apyrimidinic site) lyase [Tepidisphaeraceae bacterium]|nr:bifunctional DNA-formamidopyrimidine glycosylase/DNA-(apurinic or apyrimidinic site) lyase [Tepidisphaeraceae bacterium]